MSEIDKCLANDWYIVAKADEFQSSKIKALRLLGQDIVVWRGSSPESPILAWQDRCPHRGVALSQGKIVGDRLSCRYHGWQYDKYSKCVDIPSLSENSIPPNVCVKTYQCQKRFGYIWVSLGNPNRDILSFPEWNNPEYYKVSCGPYHFRASGFRVMENNFDISHANFVHCRSIEEPLSNAITMENVEVKHDSIIIHNLRSWHQDANWTGTATGYEVKYPFIHIYPLAVRALKQIDDGREIMHWVVNVTPTDEEECMVWIELAMNYGYEIPESKMQAIQDEVAREDALIVESQRPARLPLLPRKDTDTQWPPEVHVQCDRASVAYRRWLKSLGITFGVC